MNAQGPRGRNLRRTLQRERRADSRRLEGSWKPPTRAPPRLQQPTAIQFPIIKARYACRRSPSNLRQSIPLYFTSPTWPLGGFSSSYRPFYVSSYILCLWHLLRRASLYASIGSFEPLLFIEVFQVATPDRNWYWTLCFLETPVPCYMHLHVWSYAVSILICTNFESLWIAIYLTGLVQNIGKIYVLNLLSRVHIFAFLLKHFSLEHLWNEFRKYAI